MRARDELRWVRTHTPLRFLLQTLLQHQLVARGNSCAHGRSTYSPPETDTNYHSSKDLPVVLVSYRLLTMPADRTHKYEELHRHVRRYHEAREDGEECPGYRLGRIWGRPEGTYAFPNTFNDAFGRMIR